MIQHMLAIWSLVPLPFLKQAWTSGSSQFTYCWSLAWRILSIILLACGEGNGTPLQYSCLENPMDRGAWWAAVHGVTRVGHDWATSLSLFTFMHWRRKWQPAPVFLPGESQGRQSLVDCRLWGRRVRHDWSDLAAAAAHASKVNAQNSPSQASAIHEPWTSRCSSWF